MYSVIQYFITFGVSIPILIGVLNNVYRRKEFVAVFVLLIISLIIEVVDFIRIKYDLHSVSIFNVFTIIEFILLWHFYSKFHITLHSSRVNSIILLLFLIIAIIDLFFVNGFERMNNITISVESITLIIYSLISFYLIMSRMLFDKLLDAPFFWMNIAVLFYFSGSLFLFLFGNYLMKQGNSVYMEMYKIHTFVNAIWYLFISIGFWKVKKA